MMAFSVNHPHIWLSDGDVWGIICFGYAMDKKEQMMLYLFNNSSGHRIEIDGIDEL